MRILLVVHGFPPLANGGTEIYAESHARALIEGWGDEVLVLTRENDAAQPEFRVRTETRNGLTIAWINNTFLTTRGFEDTYRNDAIAVIASEIIDGFRPDIAHIHHLTCLSTTIVDVLVERAVPCAVTLHDYWLMCHRGQLLDRAGRLCDGPGSDGCGQCLGSEASVPSAVFSLLPAYRAVERSLPAAVGRRVRQAAEAVVAAGQSDPGREQERKRLEHMRAVCERVTHFFAPSDDIRNRFVRFGIPPTKITLARLGLAPAPPRLRSTSSRKLRIGFLGGLVVSKAPHVLLAAFRGLPPGAASLEIIGRYERYHGDDGYWAELEPLLWLEGVRVRGAISHDEVLEALASFDVVVVPSIWPENSPLVISEAFRAGVPVVASRIGGIPEIVEEGRNGLLVEPGDVPSLQSALERLIHEPGLLDTLRAGLSPVRTIAEDVRLTRTTYDALLERQVQKDPAYTDATPTVGQVLSDPPPQRQCSIAAVVLNYKAPDDTLLAVKSLRASRRPLADIIVVDNDSTDACRKALKDVWADIVYVQNSRNLGFSGGVNVGIRLAIARGAERVLLVNSDVIVPPDCVEHLNGCFSRRPDAGIVGPIVLARSDPARIASLGMSYSPITGRMRHQSVDVPVDTLTMPADVTVDGVSGCLMLVDRRVFDRVGHFHEEYFFSLEDLDFCLMARRAGFTTAIARDARVYHEGGRSIGAQSPRRLYFAARNHLLMAARVGPHRGRLGSMCRAVSIVALNVAHAVITPGATPYARIAAVAKGTRDYVRGRWGDDSSG